MAFSATTLTATRDIIATALGTISGLTVYATGDATPALPSVEIQRPSFTRPRVDEPDDQLGALTLRTRWPLKLRVDGDSLAVSSTAELGLISQILGVFAVDSTLGTTAATGFSLQCSVETVDPDDDPVEGVTKPTRGYLLVLAITQQV